MPVSLLSHVRKEELASGHHALLCSRSQIVESYQSHVFDTLKNEHFLLGLRLVSKCLQQGRPIPAGTAECFWPNHFGSGVRDPLKNTEKAYGLLKKVFPHHSTFFETFSFDQFAHLIGRFHLVNAEIQVVNPFSDLPCPPALGEPLKKLRGTSKLFEDFLGNGYFMTLSKTNHSCAPHIEIGFDQDVCLEAKAIHGIAAGQQIFQSYIEEGQDLQSRRQELARRYLFFCECHQCLEDERASP